MGKQIIRLPVTQEMPGAAPGTVDMGKSRRSATPALRQELAKGDSYKSLAVQPGRKEC